MASADGELEEQLLEAGNKLLQPSTSVEELLSLLDQVENFLSRVEQSPSKSMQTALSPSMKALVADELLRHPDVDVKVAVASCISEITRITAPDAPYDDNQMKDVFQLIVSSFENLSDKSSRSYNKRTLILETVAKVRSCVVMLDLECDALIVEMFQHFLKAIRDYHPENVFSSMETIMTLVLEESEDISFELISPILASVKKDNKEFLPTARNLGKKVLENCATKLKPSLLQAKKSLDFSLDDYSKVIASICNGTTGTDGQNDENASGQQLTEETKLAKASSEGAAQTEESKLAELSSEGAVQADEDKLAVASPSEAAQDQATKESVTETRPEGDHSDVDISPKSILSNGVAKTGNEDRLTGNEDKLAGPESSKKLEHTHQADDQSVDTDVSKDAEPDDSECGKIEKSESKLEQTSKQREGILNSLISLTEPSDSSRVDSDKEAEGIADDKKSHSKEVCGSPTEEPSAEVAKPSENEKENIQLSSPNPLESKPMNFASPSPSGSVPDEIRPKKAGRPKKKDNTVQEDPAQEVAPSVTVVSKHASEGISDSEAKPQRRSGKKAPAGSTEEKIPVLVDKSKIESGTTSDSDDKLLKHCGRKVDARNNNGDGSSSKKKEDGKTRGRRKATSVKDVTKSSSKDDDKEMVSSPKPASKLAEGKGHLEETPKMNSKRKRTPGKVMESNTTEHGENLVGSNVKVWWPEDEMFYEGVIHSFISVENKHKVLYTDGDEEILNLREERWELIGGESMLDGEQATECRSPDPSPEMHKKKKAKTNTQPSSKQGNMEVSRGGEASSSKLKGAAAKSGRKSRDESKVDGKSKDNTSKFGSKSVDDSGDKSKDRFRSSGKSVRDATRTASKSKDVDGGTPNSSSTKSKMDTPKTTPQNTPKTAANSPLKSATKSKGKASKSGSKSNANGSAGKVKSGLVKVKETEGKEKSPGTMKTPESAKGKSLDTSKEQETDAKSGKKRRRGVKS